MGGRLPKSRVSRLIRTWCLLKPHFLVIEIQVVGTTPDPIMYVPTQVTLVDMYETR